MSVLRRGLADPMTRVIGARAITFPLTVASGLVWLRLVIDRLGTEDYAFLALVTGLQFLLVFLDLGMSANVLEAAGRHRSDRSIAVLAPTLAVAARTVLLGNLAFLLLGATLLWAGVWGSILGFPERASTAGWSIVLILALNAVVRPISLSTSLVAGLGRPAVATWAQGLTGPASLAMLAVLLAAGAPLPLVAATPIAGQLVSYTTTLIVSLRMVPGLAGAVGRSFRQRAPRGLRLRHLAIPMLVIMVVGPFNDQLDRLVLSHRSSVDQLAIYSLATQLSSSAMSFVTVLTPQLWSEFARLRADGGPQAAVRGAFRRLRQLWPLAVVFGAGFCVASHWIGPWIADDRLRLPWSLCAALGLNLTLSAVSLVLGLGLTDPPNLRLQALLLPCTTAANLALTVALAGPLGALGPGLASVAAAVLHIPLLVVLAVRVLKEPGAGAHTRPGAVVPGSVLAPTEP